MSSAPKHTLTFIQRLEQGPLQPFLGVQGGTFLRGRLFNRLQNNPKWSSYNNVLFLAPAWKWGLALVPLIGVFTGNPPVENLDVNTSLALASTGAIWAYYSTLVRPKATGLFYVSVALFLANGYNVVRRYQYEEKKKQPVTLQNVSATS